MLDRIQCLEPTRKRDMHIPIEGDLLIRIKQVSAAKHYKSMAEMVRYVMEEYLKAEGV